ncbi:MAG: glycine cleavage system protein H [Deltaproteobacteria bacterium]|nr:glycine cleavage system protein H [Deltaproteobacteria bacterium]
MSNQNRDQEGPTPLPRPPMAEVFGFQVPTSTYYLHRGHAWAVLESPDQVRVGLDDFSQKLLGRADDLKLPEVGKVYYQDHICLALVRQGHKAPFLGPMDGTVSAINPKVRQKPGLIHDDPYGEGWLFMVTPSNLQRNLNNLLCGDMNAAWIDHEAHRLLGFMDSAVGVTRPDGGAIIDDVYGHYPDLGWRPLVQEFLLPVLTSGWQRKSKAPDQEQLKREVMRVLNRTSEDRTFCRALVDMQAEVLEDYMLSSEATTAILSGHLAWLNEHVGDLTQKQLRFVLSCLEPVATA